MYECTECYGNDLVENADCIECTDCGALFTLDSTDEYPEEYDIEEDLD